jgi:hypothetical protein
VTFSKAKNKILVAWSVTRIQMYGAEIIFCEVNKFHTMEHLKKIFFKPQPPCWFQNVHFEFTFIRDIFCIEFIYYYCYYSAGVTNYFFGSFGLLKYLFIYLFLFICNWVDTRWQEYSAHLHTNSTQNAENGTYIKI